MQSGTFKYLIFIFPLNWPLKGRETGAAYVYPSIFYFITVFRSFLTTFWMWASFYYDDWVLKWISYGRLKTTMQSWNGNVAAAPNFTTVRHVFEALYGAQIMYSIYHFKSWEVRNPMLQTVRDLDLKRRSYGRLKTDYTKLSGNFAPWNPKCEKSFPRCENFAPWNSKCEIFFFFKWENAPSFKNGLRNSHFVAKWFSKTSKWLQNDFQASKWVAKMFLFFHGLQKCFSFPFGCKTWPPSYEMASKLQNDVQKHFAKPREIAKMPTEPHNHASKEESPLRSHMKSLIPFLTS